MGVLDPEPSHRVRGRMEVVVVGPQGRRRAGETMREGLAGRRAEDR